MDKVILVPKAREYFNFKIYKIYLKDFNIPSSWESLQQFKKFINYYVENFKG